MKKITLLLPLLIGFQQLFAATFNIANGDVTALINAINTANGNGQSDIINLANNGIYNLTTVNYTSSNPGETGLEAQRGLPNILSDVTGLDLTINGNGATIQRDTAAPDFGLFSCTGYTIFNNVTFRNGKVNAQGAAIFVQFKGHVEVNNCFFYDNESLIDVEGGGGGIYTKSLSILKVTNCYFENNKAINQGGAISNLLSDMTVINCTFKNNSLTDAAGGEGGAIYSDGARGDNGQLIMRNNLYEGNTINGAGQGGGMFLFPYNSQFVEITGCTFKNNIARQGGGLWHKGGGSSGIPDSEIPLSNTTENTTLLLNNCVFDGNSAVGPIGSGTGIGGGLWLSNCIITEIHSLTFKNNIAWLGGAAAFFTDRFFTVKNSTFNNNTAELSGAIAALISAPLDITNCTFVSNTVKLYGGAISVPHNSHAVNITNCTFANNSANGASNSQSSVIHSGNVSTTNNTVTIKNNIFSNNTVSNIYGNTWRDCNVELNDGGNNIFFPMTTGAHCLVLSNTNFADPLLGPLANNGGPTQTMALLTGSPAINAGSGCSTTDQRGVARVGICDIGAFEYQPTLPVSLINFEVKKLASGVNVIWKTASENNSSHFELLHATDASGFKMIANITSTGNATTGENYSFKHAQPVNGNNYYKLIQFDKNGKRTEFEVKSVRFQLGAAEEEILLFPNPASQVVTAKFAANTYTKLEVLDMFGKVVISKKIGISDTEMELDVARLLSGTYMVALTRANSKSIQKLIKL